MSGTTDIGPDPGGLMRRPIDDDLDPIVQTTLAQNNCVAARKLAQWKCVVPRPASDLNTQRADAGLAGRGSEGLAGRGLITGSKSALSKLSWQRNRARCVASFCFVLP